MPCPGALQDSKTSLSATAMTRAASLMIHFTVRFYRTQSCFKTNFAMPYHSLEVVSTLIPHYQARLQLQLLDLYPCLWRPLLQIVVQC